MDPKKDTTLPPSVLVFWGHREIHVQKKQNHSQVCFFLFRRVICLDDPVNIVLEKFKKKRKDQAIPLDGFVLKQN
ncbi:hypothetical protein BaRGS_00017897, partial [Batillaria attramentaria]